MSAAIEKLVALAGEAALKGEHGDWTKASVYWFDALIPPNVRAAGESDSTIDYFDSEGTPHNPAGEGFIDRRANIAISFLLEFKEC